LLSSCKELRETQMDREAFQAWLAEADGLTARQREEAARVLAEPASLAAVLALLEARIDGARRCPHCRTEGAVIRGRSNGLKRYCCKGCGRTFNALTGTALARLRKKALWAAFAEGLSDGDTVKGAAERCGVANTTSFRWRHRFLAAIKGGAVKLKGIVEADETYVLDSRKGARKLDRQPRKRGGVARKRGLSREQVPILVAADRSGSTFTNVLPDTTAAIIRVSLETAIERDAILVTDGAPFFPPHCRDLAPAPWASPTNRSTTRPASAAAASFISTPSTAATNASNPSFAAVAAWPPNISAATSPGTTWPSCPSCRPRVRCSPRSPG
jgi:transposase-like protein